MLDHRPASFTPTRPQPAPLPGPGRAESGWARCLALMLDEIDHGLLLLDGQGNVRLLNHRARLELDDRHPLQLEAGHLRARLRAEDLALAEALAAAQRGQRRLLTLGEGEQCVSAAVVPIGADALGGGPATMLLLGKRLVCENLTVQGFARSRKLTPAETRVLEALCAGVPPAQIAEQQGVRISTVRTQIGCLREKTGARSIRALVRMVAVLPPMVPALRGETLGPGNPLGALLEDMGLRPR
jgi:DNA-binding CsgD family transcriptional regulator